MKQLLALLIALLSAQFTFSQTWQQIINPTDPVGNRERLDFYQPLPGGEHLGVFRLADGTRNMVVAKYDANDTPVWSKMFWSNASGTILDVTLNFHLDNDSSEILLVMLDGHNFNQFSRKWKRFHLVKMDLAGNVLWRNTFVASGTSGLYQAILELPDGSYIIGGSEGNEWWGAMPPGFVKVSPTGNILWHKKIQYTSNAWPNGYCTASSMELAPDGNIIVSAHLYETPTGQFYDPWILKIDTAGNPLANLTHGRAGASENSSILKQLPDSTYIVVSYTPDGTIGGTDVEVKKLDSNFNVTNAVSIGTPSDDGLLDVELTGDSLLYISGLSDGMKDNPAFDGFLIQLDTAFNMNWSKGFGIQGGDDYAYLNGVATDGTVSLSGLISENGDDPIAFTTNASGMNCSFYDSTNFIVQPIPLANYNQFNYSIKATVTPFTTDPNGISDSTFIPWNFTNTSITFPVMTNTSICLGDSIFLQGSYRDTAGTYVDSLFNMNGCDSVVYTTLSVLPTYSTPIGNDTICQGDSLFIFGVYASQSGTYYDSLTTVSGCDSVFSRTLVVLPTTTNASTETICTGDSLLIFGNYESSAGVFYDTLQAMSTGCDSVLSVTLIVNSVDTTVSVNGYTLTATNSNATYQWINCGTMQPIMGETNQSYTATANGSYAVQVSENGCTETSSCHTITGIGIGEDQFARTIHVYPNPTHGMVNIEFGIAHEEIQFTVVDVHGKLVLEKHTNSSQFARLNLTELPSGIYFTSIRNGEKTVVLRIIKE